MEEVPVINNEFSTIHVASKSDLEAIPALEALADSIFIMVGITNLPPPADRAELEKAKAILVIGNPPIGFVRIEEIDGLAHLEQISVSPNESGKGIGGQLLEGACEWAVKNGYTSMTLSTFRDIEWNAPFYASHNFQIINKLTPGLETLKRHEIELGLHKLGPRVIMKLILSSSKP